MAGNGARWANSVKSALTSPPLDISGYDFLYPTRNFEKHASHRDAEAASPNGLEAYVWTRIYRCGIHSRINQYDIRHHTDYDSNGAAYEYHLHINYS